MTASTADHTQTTLPPLSTGPHRRRIGVISLIACFGGLLFGYDTGVANGAERPMQLELGLSDLSLGVVISSLVFAAAFGALFAGKISDAIGRRKTIIILSIMFFLGTVLVVTSPGFELLVAGRIMLGLAVGGASTVVPVYLAELAPFEIRGSITGRNELAIVSGQLAAFVMNAIIGNIWGHIDGVWRIMFALCAVPAVCLFIGMLRMPESPRWYVEKGRNDKALEVLKTVRTEERAIAEIADIERIAAEENREKSHGGLRAILSNKWLIRIVLIGMGVAMAQQLTGINSIMYYGQRILIDAGFAENAALIANIAPGIVAVIGGIIALRNMDRLDRRTTFAIGLSLTTFFHLCIGIASILLPEGMAARPWILLVLIVAFVFSMQTFLNVAVWVWLAEIFPLHIRGLGIGISVFFGRTVNGILALYVPTLIENMGITGTFFLFAGVGVIALIFVITQVPETRGRTLEALEEDVTTGAIHVHHSKKR
ncbi:sugar porter family MFS transporter [Gulosibacter chungangensis]|uniref:Sugar porter family MFS transporter n=2 Tax=Gulosibacter chungangensis TaxID=979746 RepID=A0A7J5B8E5_9MICO|nr:sugar porter family MFS transporter [Gulosibacter chungangensis]